MKKFLILILLISPFLTKAQVRLIDVRGNQYSATQGINIAAGKISLDTSINPKNPVTQYYLSTHASLTDSSRYATRFYVYTRVDSTKMQNALTQGYAATIDSSVQRSGLDSVAKRGNSFFDKNIYFNADAATKQIEILSSGYGLLKIGSDPSNYPGTAFIKFSNNSDYSSRRQSKITKDSVSTSYISLARSIGIGQDKLTTIRSATNQSIDITFTLPASVTAKTFAMVGDSPILSATAYANDAAADADSNLPSGSLYTVTGSRIVYRKP